MVAERLGRVARSYIAAMRLETDPPMSFPPPAPPPARVPRFDHVFLVMMENTDYGQVIGDRRNAPYINSLAARGTLLANYQAVYHPSDQNYLAIAGGDTFVRGAVYFPKIHIAAENLGDLLEAAGKSWKEYLEGMGTPCNVTTRYDEDFEPDDAPFINFSDIRSNPGRCRAHLVDLSDWSRDLTRAATTPAFAWLAADDYDDGEIPGNGSPKSLRVQDAWLKRTLDPLFSSPAWRRATKSAHPHVGRVQYDGQQPHRDDPGRFARDGQIRLRQPQTLRSLQHCAHRRSCARPADNDER